jgi:hypothetical protein
MAYPCVTLLGIVYHVWTFFVFVAGNRSIDKEYFINIKPCIEIQGFAITIILLKLTKKSGGK